MTTAPLYLPDSSWSESAEHEHPRTRQNNRRKRTLAAGSALCVAVVDVGLVASAYMLAYFVRFAIDERLPVFGIEIYLRLALVDAALLALLLATHGLYNFERPESWAKRLGSIASSSSTALVLAITVSYFLGDQALSRLWLATGWAMSIVALLVWRALAHRLYEVVRAAWAPSDRVLIVGANRLGRQLARELAANFQVIGYVDNGSDLEHLDLPLLGSIAELDELVQAYVVDELVVALPANRREQVSHHVARGFRRHVRVKFLPELGELLENHFEVAELGGRRYIGFVPVATVSWVKRAVDLLLVGVGLLVISPLLLGIAAAIKLDSRGPVFYRQKRVGKNGREFWMLKFRSMCQDAEQRQQALILLNEASGPLFKIRRDPRVTRVGRILRRWSLDELPQLLNVLRGEMSLVGPRPPIPSEVEKYEDWQLGRLRAVPGLTGMWQVCGRSEVPFHDMVRLDLHYIRNWSLGLDLQILLRTIPAVLTNRGAY